MSIIQPVTQQSSPRPVKPKYDLAIVKTQMTRTVKQVLSNQHLNPKNVAYIQRMADKLAKGGTLTDNEVQGLSKIQKAVEAASAEAAKAYLATAKRIGENANDTQKAT